MLRLRSVDGSRDLQEGEFLELLDATGKLKKAVAVTAPNRLLIIEGPGEEMNRYADMWGIPRSQLSTSPHPVQVNI